jgi:uncharacterized protein
VVKPLPKINDENRVFWNETKNQKLMLQKCSSCHQIQYYPRFFCANCYSESMEWIESQGKGNVYTFTVIRRAPSEGFLEDVPYTLALIELDEGVRMMSTIIEQPEDIKIGDKVEVSFKETEIDIQLPIFKKV